jgi:threonine dehydratase
MPEGTPFTKVRRTEAFGARVVLKGDTLNAAEPIAHEMAAAEGFTFVHPYDDEAIIAGQGTIGLELMDDAPDLDAVIVPIGGGGVISGIATAIKSLRSEVEVIGVETEAYPSMYSVVRGEERPVGGETIADGIAVKSPGRITREIVERLVDDIVLVSEASVEAAVQTLVTEANVVVEGAGAVPLAAVREDAARYEGRRIALVLCGANIDPRILAPILLGGMSRAGHLASFRISITDQAGVLGRVAQVIGAVGGNIVETHHQRMFAHVPVKRAELDVVVETRDARHAAEIVRRLEEAGFPTRLLSDG